MAATTALLGGRWTGTDDLGKGDDDKDEDSADEKEEDEDYSPFADEDAEKTGDEGSDEIGADIGTDSGLDEPWVAKQTEFVLKYLSSSLEQAVINKSELDNFNKFGVSLFMAGACETLSQERNLDARTMSKVLSAPVRKMGFKKQDTEDFSDNVQI